MTWWSVLSSRVRGWFGSKRLGADFDEELGTHLVMITEDNLRRGQTREEAARAARLALGGTLQIRERRREERGLPLLDTLAQDLRYALRVFGRSPGYTAVAVLTLALGIGINTTVFTIFDAVALKGLPVSDPGRLVRLQRWFENDRRGTSQYLYSTSEYVGFRDHARSLSGVVAASGPVQVAGATDSSHGQPVSQNDFSELGVSAILGRTFTASDGAALAQPVVVLSHAVWQRRFNADPSVVGTTLRMNDTVATVLGVTPEEFIGTGNPPQVPDFWAPLDLQPRLNPIDDWLHRDSVKWLQIVGRLAPGTSMRQVEEEISLLESCRPPDTGGFRTIAMKLERATFLCETHDVRFQTFVALVMAAVGMVLLIACANLANMSLARTAGRQREIGVRLALGASCGRVVRQLLTESFVLAAIGGAAGLVFSIWACNWAWLSVAEAVKGVFRTGVPFVIHLSPDARVFAYTALTSLAAGALFGLSPALQFSRRISHTR